MRGANDRGRDFSRLNLSSQTRAAFNDLLATAPKLGLNTERVAAAGLPGLRALLALKQAADSSAGKKRDAHLAQLQGTLRVLQYRKHPELVQQIQARAMALQGRGGDTEVAHVTLGEIVLPKVLQTPAVLYALRHAAGDAGIPLAHFRVGSGRNSINPETGQPEFFDDSDEDVREESPPEGLSPQAPSSEDSPPDAPIEEITVTAPRETGLVQLPQGLPEEFRVYGTPLKGAGQYGVPATMGVVGMTSKQWTEAGNAPFNVGNMSLENGAEFKPHAKNGDHTTGTAFDIRPVRGDKKYAGTNYNSPDYDRAATQRLVDTLRATGGVKEIFFDDPQITGVRSLGPKFPHADHLHVQVDPNWRRPMGR